MSTDIRLRRMYFRSVDIQVISFVIDQNIFVQALLAVGEKYTPIQLTTTFPPLFLGHLLTLLRSPTQHVRMLVLDIVHTLVDRYSEKICFKIGGCRIGWNPSTISVRLDFLRCVQIFLSSKTQKSVQKTCLDFLVSNA